MNLTKIKLPDYAWFGEPGRCAMRRNGEFSYYRDGGAWGTDIKIVDDRIISCGFSGNLSYLNNHQLIPCSKYEWWKSNGEYAGHVHADRVRALVPWKDRSL